MAIDTYRDLIPPRKIKFFVIQINDTTDVRVRMSYFCAGLALISLIMLIFPYFALVTVPTYLAILYAFVSEKIDIVYINQFDDSEE